jgi:hypothetical protein
MTGRCNCLVPLFDSPFRVRVNLSTNMTCSARLPAAGAAVTTFRYALNFCARVHRAASAHPPAIARGSEAQSLTIVFRKLYQVPTYVRVGQGASYKAQITASYRRRSSTSFHSAHTFSPLQPTARSNESRHTTQHCSYCLLRGRHLQAGRTAFQFLTEFERFVERRRHPERNILHQKAGINTIVDAAAICRYARKKQSSDILLVLRRR